MNPSSMSEKNILELMSLLGKQGLLKASAAAVAA